MENRIKESETLLTAKERLKNSATNLIIGSNIHGLPKVITRKRLSFRVIWLLLLILSACLCVNYVVKNILEYSNYDTVTKIDIIKETQSQFPAVSICNYNDTNFEMHVLSFNFNYENLVDEWENFFVAYNDLRYGKCYRFNGGGNSVEILNSTARGYSYGLRLDMYVPARNNDFGELKIFIHNKTTTPVSLNNRGFFLKSGSFNFFSIQRIFEEKLDEPFNKCYKNESLFSQNKTLIEYIKSRNRAYTQDDCFQMCQNMKYIQTSGCNCTLQSLDDVIKTACMSKRASRTQLDCTRKFLEQFVKSNPFEICSEYCPLECNSIKYEITHDFMPLPSMGRISDSFTPIREFNTYENVSKSFFAINIFYEELKYTLITQHPKMQLFGLISSIGGVFSLFLGMSLLSFIEIFEIVLEAVFILFNK